MTRVSLISSFMHRIELTQFDHRKPKLEELQRMVGGYIQMVYFPDDPLGYWHHGYVNEEGLLKNLPVNDAAACFFPQYERLVGDCVIIEDVGSWWYHSETSQKVRLATKEEALRSSQNGGEALIENGVEMYLGEDEDDSKGPDRILGDLLNGCTEDGTWWYNARTCEPVRAVTKEEVIRALRSVSGVFVERGIPMYVGPSPTGVETPLEPEEET